MTGERITEEMLNGFLWGFGVFFLVLVGWLLYELYAPNPVPAPRMCYHEWSRQVIPCPVSHGGTPPVPENLSNLTLILLEETA